jgi:hypothetical protein
MILGSAGIAQANLLTNGSFETGDFTGWTVSNNFEDTEVVSGPFYVYPAAEDGNYYAVLGPVGSDGTLSQSGSDTPGQALSLTYWLAGFGDNPSDFDATWDGSVIPGSAVTNFNSGDTYTEFSFDVTSTGSDTLAFNFRDDPDYMALDNVSLVSSTPVPEPSSLPMLLAGLGLIGGAFYFGRKKAKSI